jgi:bifunctional non-homologous end joining protein LigD
MQAADPRAPLKTLALEYPREWITPCLASETGKIPTGARWIHEIKFDGYRTQLHLRPDRPVVYSRNGHDWTSRYAALADALRELPARHAVIDAEMVVPRADGCCDYLRDQASHRASSSSGSRPITVSSVR